MSKRLLLAAIVVWAAVVGLAIAKIEVKDEYQEHEPIVAKLKAELPEGAQVRGSWKVVGGKFLPAGKDVIHIWAPPGKHLIVASGVWVLTKDIKVGDQTVPVLVDFGQYEYEKAFVVKGGGPEPGPNPQPGPEPGPIPSKRWLLIVEETANRTPEQTRKIMALREKLANETLLIVDKDNVSSHVQTVIAQVKDIDLPAFLVVSSDGDRVFYKGPLPTPEEAETILKGDQK